MEEQAAASGGTETGAAQVYGRFLDALNKRDLDAAERAVDPTRWREVCVGFTKGRIVDRIQQADMFGQMRQLFGPLLLILLVAAALLLIGIGILIGALLV